MRAVKYIGVATALALAAAGCNGDEDTASPSAVPAGLESFYEQKPSWKDCEDGFECTTVEVPLDYSKPSGDKLGISVIRLPAQDSSDRIGSLLTNPGGPGGSGVDFVRQVGRAFGADLRNRFDIVGFDPRGVAGSDPVRCNTGAQLDDFFSTDASPDDEQETRALGTEGEEFAQNCETKAADKLPHVGTVNAARDMDVLRAALGDDKLTYYGASYGTYLGAFYAEQFPKNIRALVLDGAVDPTLSSTELLIEQAKGFETALRAFAEDCVANGCPFGDSADAVVTRIGDLLDDIDKKPLTSTRDDREVTESLAVMGIARSLYVKEYWPVLRQALTKAINDSDGTILLGLADEMVDRKADGTYSNQTDANMAVNCVDKPTPQNLAAYGKAAAEAEKSAPRFGPFVVWGGVPCVYWPTQSAPEPKPLTANGADPILVVGTTRDPATPYKWSENLADQLSSGVLLTFEGDGHTAYLQGNACITNAVDDYLVTTDPPKNGTTCR
ncbi:alpha/beta hydrolase family protein [Actinomadura hallensis]|uniref:Alpha/beta hydrolase family protein n=1 Tax=Actinomadura hallensis TaxID=337895 RepID=A0A543IMS7_9ACTN|nr:alpha/beta hydrolase [Actinomadura hallensis]TQM71861.1 alpha/beta hydrolase family protein [Actinomadura hallensis]